MTKLQTKGDKHWQDNEPDTSTPHPSSATMVAWREIMKAEKCFFPLYYVFLFILMGTGTSSAATIVVPNVLANTEGNWENRYPFGIDQSQRYQQVYSASEFGSLSGPALITKIVFRPDAEYASSFVSTIDNIQINLSTTSRPPDGLDATFANNVGVDDTVVFSGPLTLSSAYTGPAAGPKDFDIAITLQTPFSYDPTDGNLLLDVRNFSGGTSIQSFDTVDSNPARGPLDSVSRVYSALGDVGSATGSWDNASAGLVTQFETAIVVAIDIKPGSDPNCFNIDGHGVIPVAILGSDAFDVTQIDPDSLMLDGFAVRVRGNKGPLCTVEDVNGDPYTDLVCQFEDAGSENWIAGDTVASLAGFLNDGETQIKGTDSICVVP